jgi:glutamyl-tRNA synthetase
MTWYTPIADQMQAIGESSLRNLNENDVIQIMRRGLFRCERPYRGAHAPLVLFKIPDGKAKAMSTLSTKLAHR